ncbi:MBL fold metallo-hydrolase [Deinococcus taeanensis]|uniref:MBL fold metallo-hydrolase n=1 Tax=Deinococcus taeanensis TaxID=2737050 RepID=UPI001CDC33B9|nr:MBL fold metallo-hydrolase [Deinococcus taeanensis]UBV43852.1 MBL fold metallo-hydrolase [Deinococcus taeanensis]
MSAGVHTLDLNFQGTPGVIAVSVFDTGDGLAVVDPGPGSTLATLKAGLNALGAGLADVRHVLLTHIHFDHAGAAGTLLTQVPAARAYVHERGAAHLTRPERLVASATQIYGDQMDRLWGAMTPVAPDRLLPLSGGETLRLGNRDVQVHYTPGHAVHHVSYHAGDDLFLGDVGGIRLDADQTPRAPTPPPDINLSAWRDSLDRLEQLPARTLHLTHFGAYPNTPAHWAGLRTTMTVDAQRILTGLDAGQDPEALTAAFTGDLMRDLHAEHPDLPARYEFACPPWMSVQGLIRYWRREAARGEQR